jgi:hypothetical protein
MPATLANFLPEVSKPLTGDPPTVSNLNRREMQ